MRERHGKGTIVGDLLMILGVVALWVALQAWILPRFGVST